MNNSFEEDSAWRYVRRTIQLLVVVMMTLFAGTYLYHLWLFGSYSPDLLVILMKHVPATVGLPLSAVAATSIVVIFEVQSGPIEFEGFGFKFKGAAGQIVFWIFCFLSIVSAIKLLW